MKPLTFHSIIWLRNTNLTNRIKKLEELQHAELVAEEIEAGDWEDIQTLEEDLRGNSILREAFEMAEKMFEKRREVRHLLKQK